MTTRHERAVRNLLSETADEITNFCRRHQADVLERNMAIGRCLAKRLDRDPASASESLHGDHFIEELTKKNTGLGRRVFYHCLRLAAQELPADVWARMKAARVSWRTARDVGRLVGKAKSEAARTRTLATLMEKLPRNATVKAKRDFQTWLDEQLYPLSGKARHIVLDRVSGRVFSTKLKTFKAAKKLAARRKRLAAPDRICVVRIPGLG